jgi:tetratricopeptide (TPR) repeat protein
VFDYDTLYTLHVTLRNLCIILINQGDRDLKPTLFELQKQSIESGFHFYKGKISYSSFISVVINALEVKEVEWTHQFIETHKDLIIGETVDKNYFRFCWAHYLYHMGDYEQALDFIPQNIKEISYALIAKRLEIKAFYEYDLGVAISKADAYRAYVSRLPNYNFPRETMNYNANFARFFFQIQQMPVGIKERAYKVIERIAESQYVSDREWLYEKARLRGNLEPEEVEAIVLQTPVLEEKFEEKEPKNKKST